MPKFAAGAVKFQNDVFPGKKALFDRLSRGQAPEAVFITCSDSRIDTAMLTQTDPGELFVCRNAGNIVPPHTEHAGGMSASIEFAVAVLKVPHIVVCGHTECGAMAGALNPEGLDELEDVRQWLGHADAAVAVVNERGASLSPQARMTMLLEQNVILQLDHLKTHPCVARRLKKGDLALHGWVYDIKAGSVRAYDEQQGRFQPLENQDAAEIAKPANGCNHD